MRLLIILFLFFTAICSAQNKYPQDYFMHPLDIELVAAGTFAELRSNHFHSGLDLKTKRVEGLNIYASASGYVSRIKIAHYGYGKALYLTHPNGYTTVYAHLQRFSDKIEAYIKRQQYKKESFEIELFPDSELLKVNKGEVVAYSGNTGSSSGPHLHFEIRDNAERPLNPMLFGMEVKDTKKPVVSSIYAYPIGPDSHVNKSNLKQKLRLVPQPNGDYKIENIEAYGKIGFAISTIDRQDLAGNKNGVYKLESFFNGMQNFQIDFKRFSFAETKHLNRLIDYKHFKDNKQRLQKLFKETNNPLSMYDNVVDDGYITIDDEMASVYKIKISDFKGNETVVMINLKGLNIQPEDTKQEFVSQNYVYSSQQTDLQEGNYAVSIPKNTFYDDFYMDFKVSNDTLTLHKPEIPVKKYFTISYDVTNYSKPDKDKLYIAELIGWNNFPSYSSTKRKGNILSSRTKDLGTYVLATDTKKPTIKPVNFSNGKWLSKYRFLKVKINDKETGIGNYRATVNGKWILMEYDPKKKILTHDFTDNIVTDTKNNLKVIVTDNVGNSTTFEAIFYKK